MPKTRTFFILLATIGSIACTELSCMEQYNPRPFWSKLTSERELAHRKEPKLQPNGDLPREDKTTEN